MQELPSTRFDQTVVGIAAGRSETRVVGDEGAPLFHAGQHAGDADDVVKEVDQGLWTLQPLQVAVQDDAIPAGIDELDSRAE